MNKTATSFFLHFLILIIALGSSASLMSQGIDLGGKGNISGSFQSDAQWYFEDSVIRANTVDEKVLSNTFMQLTYQNGNFSAGLRYEAYLNPILGFRGEYKGQGIPYRFIRYAGDVLDITVGNIYDQFGNGMTFRTYQEWNLGIDNSLDGVRIKFTPVKGLAIRGLIGRERKFWNKSTGLQRAADAEVVMHDFFPKMLESKFQLTLGGSFSNRYLADDNVELQLPENVSVFSGRFNLTKASFNLNGELAYKINDPFNKNNFVYNPGIGAYLNASYTGKGFGITASVKRIDNMDFRSERNVLVEELTINFLPPTTIQHTYRLPTLYPYATQPNGEFGGQVDLIYTIPKGSALGGKYGTTLYLNYARVNGLDTTFTDPPFIYTSSFFGSKEKRYFEDFNVEVTKKWSKKFKSTIKYIYLVYNKDIIEFASENAGFGTVYVHTGVFEGTYQIKRKRNLRFELQHMYTKTDLGSWAMVLLEYSAAPHWFFTVFDEYNYGNPDPERRAHYYNGNIAYILGASRIAVGYGRQRAGLLCVGGICRVVPASSGFSLSISSTF